ncbi:hypothetical protein Ssi03_01090 [Sphaerisporangium siamense]|nr:hypothetical protein Ssi03_01090 [Sphaerisporangium siamense]
MIRFSWAGRIYQLSPFRSIPSIRSFLSRDHADRTGPHRQFHAPISARPANDAHPGPTGPGEAPERGRERAESRRRFPGDMNRRISRSDARKPANVPAAET